jgi:photosystem II stability/assembly factor-like uncharacterized protein
VWITAPARRPLIYLTRDGGDHWSRRPLRFQVAREVEKLVALDALTAIAQTAARTLVTHDGGVTWRPAAL